MGIDTETTAIHHFLELGRLEERAWAVPPSDDFQLSISASADGSTHAKAASSGEQGKDGEGEGGTAAGGSGSSEDAEPIDTDHLPGLPADFDWRVYLGKSSHHPCLFLHTASHNFAVTTP